MSEEFDLKRAVEQLLELDTFFADDLAVKGPDLDIIDNSASQTVNNTTEIPIKTITPAETAKKELSSSSNTGRMNITGENMTKEQALEQVAQQIKSCTACQISGTRQNPVPGEGDPHAELVFVGEAPGADEDRTGRPFVGRAGQLLTKIIAAMGLEREQVYICNTLKCRPPENRDPLAGEKQACKHFLQTQLSIIKPKVIVALGSHAARELLETDQAIGKLRGRFHDYKPTEDSEPIKLMPTYHPAYLLRNYSPDNRKRVWEDMQKVMNLLGLKSPSPRK
ncbi:MAG: uracil-DNA glycosylase family protein [Sedimentisphaeraceae bacterium JB056]